MQKKPRKRHTCFADMTKVKCDKMLFEMFDQTEKILS